MKANELMIGDLINGFGVVRRVTGIYGLERPEDDGLLTTMVPGWKFPESNLSFRPCYARPIPMTEAILDKNCADVRKDEYNRSYQWTWENSTGSGYVELGKWADGTSISEGFYFSCNGGEYAIMILHYVHELQHALRLCGIEKEIEL